MIKAWNWGIGGSLGSAVMDHVPNLSALVALGNWLLADHPVYIYRCGPHVRGPVSDHQGRDDSSRGVHWSTLLISAEEVPWVLLLLHLGYCDGVITMGAICNVESTTQPVGDQQHGLSVDAAALASGSLA
jgi:hypothetical protein